MKQTFNLYFVFCAVVALLLIGCAREHTVFVEAEIIEEEKQDLELILKHTPDWYTRPPASDHSLFAIGQGDSFRLNSALQKARLRAELDLVKSRKSSLSAAEKVFSDDVADQYQQAIDKLVAGVDVGDYRVVKQEIFPAQGRYYAFVLLEQSNSITGFDETAQDAFNDLYRRIGKDKD